MASSNSPRRMPITFHVNKQGPGYASLADGINVKIWCLWCEHGTEMMVCEDDVLRHMSRCHKHNKYQFWISEDNFYTNSWEEFVELMDAYLTNN